MNKCEIFLDFFDEMQKHLDWEIPEEVQEFYDILKGSKDNFSNKPIFTESGLEILSYMQKVNLKSYKAKEIAEGMMISSRKVSGSMRKLCTDGFVEKFGQSPVIYALTEKGKNFDIISYIKENNE